MPTKSDKPKFGDLVESNPNHQKLKQALEQHLSSNEELETVLNGQCQKHLLKCMIFVPLTLIVFVRLTIS